MMPSTTESPLPFEPIPEIGRDALAEHGGFRRLFNSRSPVILRGMAADWDFMRTWSPDYLSELMGDFQCTIVRDSRPDLADETCSLETYFREHAHLATMTICSLQEQGEYRVFSDIPLPNPCFDKDMLTAFFFFHSHPDQGSLPHCHQDAFNLLQSGRKHWLMYDADPEQSPVGWEVLRDCLSEYGKGRRVREWFDEGLGPLRRADMRVYEGVQEAGDIVYVPVRFAHAAINLSETLGVVAVVDRPGIPYQKGPGGRYVLPGKA
ncbi:MAG: hypothetical protein AAGF11_35060 [Myxococcota bacterium]